MESRSELITEINKIYKELLHRQADDEGLNHWLHLIEKNKLSLNELRTTIKNSQEYKMKNPLEGSSLSVNERMEREWDQRAKEDLKFSIRTVANQTDDEFWESGKKDFEELILGKNTPLEHLILNDKKPSDMKVLEIGCGIGRIMRSTSELFGTVYGVDVSPTMIEEAKKELAEYDSCKLFKNNGSDLSMLDDDFFDFCYSFIVFQHIPDKSVIRSYLQEINRVLKSGAILRIQLSGMDEHTEINTWNGVFYTSDEAKILAKDTGFDILQESGEQTKYFWLTLKKSAPYHENYENTVSELYQKILKRKPDKTGLYYFTSQLKGKKLTVSEVSDILSNSEEGLAIKNFSHYTDKYWNNLPQVKRYKNKLSTGNENTHWLEDMKTRFKQFIPFESVLVVGCGNGWLERFLFDEKIAKNIDAFDISEEYLKEAKNKKENRNIRYFVDDINNLQKLGKTQYDAIFNFAILHHAENIDDAMKKLSNALKPNGLIFNEEYVGPARNQYSDDHLQIMLSVMSDLPERFRSKYTLRPALENFRVEPSEAIHSDMVVSTFKKYFDVVYERSMNGGIAYQILWNNIDEFTDESDPEAKKWLEYILQRDKELTESGQVPVMFWYCVGKSKQKLHLHYKK